MADIKEIEALAKKFIDEKFNSYKDSFDKTMKKLESLKEFKQKVKSTKKSELASAGVVLYFIRQNSLIYSSANRDGIKIKEIADFFGVRGSSITQKATDFEYVAKSKKESKMETKEIEKVDESKKEEIIKNKKEFIDKANRMEVAETYYEIMDISDMDEKVSKLQELKENEPHFFDTYISLAEYYLYQKEDIKSYKELINEGYAKAKSMICTNGKFPQSLLWQYAQNRHIIRMILAKGFLEWNFGNKKSAIKAFDILLNSDVDDSVGARYYILAILEGYKNLGEFEKEFNLNYSKMFDWFSKKAKKRKYSEYFDKWFEYMSQLKERVE